MKSILDRVSRREDGKAMNHLKAVIFDLDNTVLDRTGTFARFTASFLGKYFDHLDSTQELFDRIIFLDQDGYKDKSVLFDELLAELPWKGKPQKNEIMHFYNAEYVKSAVLMERAKEVIAYLKRKYKIGLITNGRTAIQYGKINQLGIADDFDTILVSEEAGIKKPDPRIFEMALINLDLSPNECVYVGDHPVNDMEGASKAGMETIWIKVNQPWREGLSVTPKYTIKRLSELMQLL